MSSSAPKPRQRLPDAVPLRAWQMVNQEGRSRRAVADEFEVSYNWAVCLVRRGRQLEQQRQRAAERMK